MNIFLYVLFPYYFNFLVIFNNIFYCRYVKDGNHLHHLGQKMEDLIFNVADSNFFFNDLEECDQVS